MKKKFTELIQIRRGSYSYNLLHTTYYELNYWLEILNMNMNETIFYYIN